jgi:hypothetical protein
VTKTTPHLYAPDRYDVVAAISGAHRDVVKRVLLAAQYAPPKKDDGLNLCINTIEAATGLPRGMVLVILNAAALVP